MTRDQIIEAVARASCNLDSSMAWENHDEVLGRERYRREARAAILAHYDAIRKPPQCIRPLTGAVEMVNAPGVLMSGHDVIQSGLWAKIIDALRKEIEG